MANMEYFVQIYLKPISLEDNTWLQAIAIFVSDQHLSFSQSYYTYIQIALYQICYFSKICFSNIFR